MKALPLKGNGFRFYKCNIFYNEGLYNTDNKVLSNQETTRFEHIHLPNSTVSFVDNITSISHVLSVRRTPIIFNENNVIKKFNYDKMQFLFCEFTKCMNNTIHVINFDYTLLPPPPSTPLSMPDAKRRKTNPTPNTPPTPPVTVRTPTPTPAPPPCNNIRTLHSKFWCS